LALASLLDRLAGDRVALVVFSGEARLSCPLTTDLGAVKLFLDLVEADMLQQPGTSIGPALRVVGKLVPEGSERNVAVVLFPDGGPFRSRSGEDRIRRVGAAAWRGRRAAGGKAA